MSKKQLNASAVINELAGQSVFFKKDDRQDGASAKSKVEIQPLADDPKTPTRHETMTPSNNDTVVSRHHDTTPSRYHDTTVETVRKAVKEFGKEAATHRFTQDEKRAIADLVYTYGRQGIRTSENEITRIAINLIVQDYREYGEESFIGRVLKALTA